MEIFLCMNKIQLRKCVRKREPFCSSHITEMYCQNITQECVDSVFGNNDLKKERESYLILLTSMKVQSLRTIKASKEIKNSKKKERRKEEETCCNRGKKIKLVVKKERRGNLL